MVDQLTPYQKEYLQQDSERTSKGAQLVAQYVQVFSANTNYGVPMTFKSNLTGSGSITNPTANSPWVGLTTTTASGDKVEYQTKLYLRYWAYRTHRCTFAVSFATEQANYVQQAGMFDANDGWFFQHDENGLHVVHRTATSGSPVDTVVSRESFNLDRLDGNGPSGLRLPQDFRFDRGITYGIQYNWYGTQVIKFFMTYGGSLVPLHEFVFSGQLDGVPFTRTAQLPLRFVAENTDTAAAGATMRVGSCSHSVADDVGRDLYMQFSASTGTTGITVDSTTTWQDLVAVRPKATISGITNRALFELTHWLLLAESNSIEYRIIDNVTYTGGTWGDVGGGSLAEYSVSPGTQAGTPRVVDINYLYAGRNDGGSSPESINDANIQIGLDTVSNAQYCFVVQARKLSVTTATAFAAITWAEQY